MAFTAPLGVRSRPGPADPHLSGGPHRGREPEATLTSAMAGCRSALEPARSGTPVVALLSGRPLATATQGAVHVSVTDPPAPTSATTSEFALATGADTTGRADTSSPTSIAPPGPGSSPPKGESFTGAAAPAAH